MANTMGKIAIWTRMNILDYNARELKGWINYGLGGLPKENQSSTLSP